MPSDIKERVVARNVKTLDRAALLQKAARPAALRVGETAKAANPAHTRERRGDEAEGGWAAARGESERTAHEGFAATANGARVARAIRRRNVPKERARTTFPSAERGERRTPRGCAASCGSSREASSPSPRAPRPANARAREAMRTRAQAASRARAARASRKATAKGANAAARRAASSAGRFARMAALQARAATAALTGLGSSAAAVVVVTCLAAFVATSAFGIFLMGGDIGDGNPPLREVVAEIDAEHAAKVEEAKASAECDEVSVSGGKSPWKETLAVFAVKLAADAENPLDVLTLDAARQGALRAVFWDMNSIETEIEEAEPSDSDGEDAPPAKVLRVTLSAKTAEQMLTIQLEKGTRELEYLNSVLENLSLAEGERDLQEIRQELVETGYLRRGKTAAKRQKRVSGKPMEFRSSAGLRISVGKNNSQNDQLTTKLAYKSDIWLHTQKIHGSHVILWLEGGEADAQSLTEAAILAATFSQAGEGSRVPVDYTPVKYVKKPAGARPGMVVYTTYQTAVVDPDPELAKQLRVK